MKSNGIVQQIVLVLFGVILAMTIIFFKIDAIKKPTIIVNMPKDTIGFSTMETNTIVINNERAILWWTVYNKTIDKNGEFISTAIYAANTAVKTVYDKSK